MTLKRKKLAVKKKAPLSRDKALASVTTSSSAASRPCLKLGKHAWETQKLESFKEETLKQQVLSANLREENQIGLADQIAQRYALDVLDDLARIARQSESDTARISAIREILNRGLGRSSLRKRVLNEVELPTPVLNIVPYTNGPSD